MWSPSSAVPFGLGLYFAARDHEIGERPFSGMYRKDLSLFLTHPARYFCFYCQKLCVTNVWKCQSLKVGVVLGAVLLAPHTNCWYKAIKQEGVSEAKGKRWATSPSILSSPPSSPPAGYNSSTEHSGPAAGWLELPTQLWFTKNSAAEWLKNAPRSCHPE